MRFFNHRLQQNLKVDYPDGVAVVYTEIPINPKLKLIKLTKFLYEILFHFSF